MKKLSILFAALVLLGAGCLFSQPQPAEGPAGTEPTTQGDETLRLYDESGALIVELTVSKQHRIGTSPCPDMFGPISVEWPAGWGDVPLPPSTNVPWLDLPDMVTPGEPFQMGFNCNINRFDTHGEVAAVNFDFAGFAAEHPGVEHQAGAPANGTFFVITETWDGPPVADFALPYECCSDCGSVEYCKFKE